MTPRTTVAQTPTIRSEKRSAEADDPGLATRAKDRQFSVRFFIAVTMQLFRDNAYRHLCLASRPKPQHLALS